MGREEGIGLLCGPTFLIFVQLVGQHHIKLSLLCSVSALGTFVVIVIVGFLAMERFCKNSTGARNSKMACVSCDNFFSGKLP